MKQSGRRLIRRLHGVISERENTDLEIIRAKHSGFCFGVDRAIEMAFSEAGKEDRGQEAGDRGFDQVTQED